MTCPRCFFEFDGSPRSCPECGVGLFHNLSGIVKTSAVMISSGDENAFYDSVQEVPERLRKQLLETTASRNSGTIVIADRAGKEQLTQVLARRHAGERTRGENDSEEAETGAGAQPADLARRFSWLAWVAFALVLILAAGISAFFGLHW